MTENAVVKTVEHTEASALPETGWLWRRVYAFAVTVAMTLLAWRISERIEDVGTLRLALRYAFWTILLMCMLYMAGASAEAITKLIGAIRTTRRETITTAPPPATLTSTPGGTKVETPPDADPAPVAPADAPPWDRKP